MEEGRYDGSKRCNLSLAGERGRHGSRAGEGCHWGSLTTLIFESGQATRVHSNANTDANGMNKALSGPFLVSRTGDVGSTKRQVKVPK